MFLCVCYILTSFIVRTTLKFICSFMIPPPPFFHVIWAPKFGDFCPSGVQKQQMDICDEADFLVSKRAAGNQWCVNKETPYSAEDEVGVTFCIRMSWRILMLLKNKKNWPEYIYRTSELAVQPVLGAVQACSMNEIGTRWECCVRLTSMSKCNFLSTAINGVEPKLADEDTRVWWLIWVQYSMNGDWVLAMNVQWTKLWSWNSVRMFQVL